MNWKEYFDKWDDHRKTLVLSVLVGVLCGLAAVLLHLCIRGIQQALTGWFGESVWWNLLYLIYPGAGMLLALLFVRYVVKDDIGHGVTKVLLAVSKSESRIKPHNTWSSLVASCVTIGFGGSVGAEAPMVYTGAAIGSNVAQRAGLPYRYVTILLGCGAAGAVAGIFKAPLAGVLFTLEILLFNISMSSILPLLLSTVSATVVSYAFLGMEPLFEAFIAPFSMRNLPFYVILGLVCAATSLYFTRMTLYLEDKIKAKGSPYARWALSALALGLLLFLFPPLYGEGYGDVREMLSGNDLMPAIQTPLAFMLQNPWGLVFFFLLVLLLKIFSMTLTNAGGGVGGTFGPTLFVGALTGFLVARIINLSGIAGVPQANFVLVGMAGLMAGVMQAPMTAIFLIAEVTGGYGLFIPLILTASISFGCVRIFEKYSIYTKRIAQSGDLLTHDSDQAVLTLLKTSDLVRDKYPRVHLDWNLREVVKVVSQSTAAVFPVVDENGHFQGILEMDTIRPYILKVKQYDKLHVYNLMSDPPERVYVDEKMDAVMAKFDRTDAWRLPVLTGDDIYLGFISKSRILMAYREELKEITSQDI